MRRYGFYYRYDTPAQRELLNQLWALVNDRLNFFTPTKKPLGYTTDTVGRRTRLYDNPTTPCERLLAAGVLSHTQRAELADYRAILNVVDMVTRIDHIQQRLTGLAATPTRRLEHEIEHAKATAMPEADWIKLHHQAS